MNPILSRHIDQINALCQKQKVQKLYSFGSVNAPTFNDTSDIDFLVSFQEMKLVDYADNYFDLCEGLEKITGRKVDLVTERSLQNPFFIESIEKTKQLLYG
ncbi:nucleotidyltransferase family protein [Ekhidna sp.]|uniref:nucleotidyltransferase family protein n=1 Tax=Ekhidna sp. TaxID=2608089 RepID=UPI003CCBA09B